MEDPATDDTHCGECGNTCAAGDRCMAGRCERERVAFEPSTDTTLEPGEHTFSSVHIPEGVTVTTTGRAEVRIVSQGDVLIEGRLNLSGGNGGAGADVTGVGTGAGSGGATDPGRARRRTGAARAAAPAAPAATETSEATRPSRASATRSRQCRAAARAP